MGAHRPDVRRLMIKCWFVARFSCSSGMIGLVSRTPTHGSLQGVSGLQFDVVCGVASGRQSTFHLRVVVLQVSQWRRTVEEPFHFAKVVGCQLRMWGTKQCSRYAMCVIFCH